MLVGDSARLSSLNQPTYGLRSNSRTPRFQTLFVDQDPDVVNALAGSFARKWPSFVRFMAGNIFRKSPGILVTPANSEGDSRLMPACGLKLEMEIIPSSSCHPPFAPDVGNA
jgi:hypothetical protein